jgi:mono/diheme cytochrome c family protein
LPGAYNLQVDSAASIYLSALCWRIVLKQLIAVVALDACLFLAVPKTVPRETPADVEHIRAGEQVFLHRCFQCHSVVEGQARFGPNLFHEMHKPHSKKTADEVVTVIREGKGRMPGFENILSDNEVADVVAYLHAH